MRSPLTPGRRRLLDQLLDELLDLAPEERQQRLTAMAQRHPRLHRLVSRLVAASTTPTELLSASVSRTAQRATEQSRTSEIQLADGARLGSWRIRRPAGRGGMGVVYEAERADGAFEMRAAIKLIGSDRPGMAERLVQERQLLARLNHPGISRLIDGGISEDGHGYLVMEWVDGEVLNNDLRRQFDPLALFGDIAEALVHAHQQLVVHGDIKPGNVLVSAEGRARLVDFGVARLLAEQTGEIEQGPRGLTPAFAAPELLAGEPPSTQSDVWALGALLSWLLTGDLPKGDGSAPSGPITQHPRSDDLTAIIARACADDPAQRYPSVAALADEIGNIRQHFAIQARPTGVAKRLRLWSRRNPIGAGLATTLSLGLLVAATAFGWQAQVVRAERDIARLENLRWEVMRNQMVELFRSAAQDHGDDSLSARDLLDASVSRLDTLLGEDELGRAYTSSMLGSLYVGLQDYHNAAQVLRPLLDTANGDLPPMLRSGIFGDLALAEVHLGNHQRALTLADQALDMVGQQPGDYRRRQSQLHQTRGSALRGLGDWPGSIDALQQAVSLAEAVDRGPNRTLAMAQNNLGVSLFYAGELEPGRVAMEAALAHWQALGLGEFADALTVRNNLATVYHQQGDLLRAQQAYEETVAQRRARFGDSAALAATMNNHGQVLMIQHRLPEARSEIEQALEMMGRFNGENSPHYALILRSAAQLAMLEGKADEAWHQLDQAESILLDTLGTDHLFTLLIQAQAARLLARQSPERALEQLALLGERMKALGASSQTHLASVYCEQAIIQLDQGLAESALDSAQRCLAMREKRLVDSHWEIHEAAALQAAAHLQTGQAGAHSALAGAVERLALTYGAGHPRLQWLQASLNPEASSAISQPAGDAPPPPPPRW
ncbi:MAG: protein kinase domain-containing protein [Wenzhouxiangella sp.]